MSKYCLIHAAPPSMNWVRGLQGFAGSCRYWADEGNRRIQRADLDGSGAASPETFFSRGEPMQSARREGGGVLLFRKQGAFGEEFLGSNRPEHY